jgi:hypothetical protein
MRRLNAFQINEGEEWRRREITPRGKWVKEGVGKSKTL